MAFLLNWPLVRVCFFFVYYSPTDTSPHCSAGPQTTGYVRLQSDHSVCLRPHPPFTQQDTAQRCFFCFFSQSLFFFLSLSHTRSYTGTVSVNVAGSGLLSASVLLRLGLSGAVVCPTSRNYKHCSFILREKREMDADRKIVQQDR